VAFFGIRASKKTNRDAITAANNRETRKWRRETLLTLASDAVTAALDLRNKARLAGAVAPGEPVPESASDHRDACHAQLHLHWGGWFIGRNEGQRWLHRYELKL
jgi:hypothetical protein